MHVSECLLLMFCGKHLHFSFLIIVLYILYFYTLCFSSVKMMDLQLYILVCGSNEYIFFVKQSI